MPMVNPYKYKFGAKNTLSCTHFLRFFARCTANALFHSFSPAIVADAYRNQRLTISV
jgi:hypothetical protein